MCPIPAVRERSDDYGHLIASLAGLSKVDIVGSADIDRLKEKNTVSRTFGSCSVMLPATERFNEQLELSNVEKKLKKLVAKLNRLETTISDPSFSRSAPLHVQQTQRKKANEMKCEIDNLQSIVDKIVRNTK